MKRAIFFFFLLVLAACTTQPVEDAPTPCPPVCSSGTDALSLQIIQPPSTVYNGERYTPSVDIINTGQGYAEGTLCITGANTEIFTGLSNCACEDFYVTLDDKDDPAFQQTAIDFGSTLITAEQDSEEYLSFVTRYKYTTYATFEACITGDPGRDTSCAIEGNKLKQSSSGPLGVTSIEEDIRTIGTDTIRLDLRIAASFVNDPQIQLFPLDSISSYSCTEGSGSSIPVEVDIVLLGKKHACSPEPTMRFEAGEREAEIVCSIEGIDTELLIGNNVLHEGWLELRYGVEQRESLPISVRASF